jgi:hypothetical protein
MKITTQQELEKLIATADKTNTIVLDEDLEITFDCTIPCNIKAYNIQARNIEAYDIEAYNIDAWNIKAHNIKYYAFCIACRSLKCESISGNRENSFHKCLDQEIEIIKKEETVSIELTQEQLDKIKHLI